MLTVAQMSHFGGLPVLSYNYAFLYHAFYQARNKTIFSMVYWTEGEDKKARVILGDMEKKSYKVLLSSPTVTKPNLVEYNPGDGYLYFTDADQKILKKVNPSVGKTKTDDLTGLRLFALRHSIS